MANVYEQDSTKLDQPWMRIASTLLPCPWRGSVRREPETKMHIASKKRLTIAFFAPYAGGWYCLATVEPRR